MSEQSSMHTLALQYVATKVKGKIIHRQTDTLTRHTNNFAKSVVKIGSNIPDVISDGAIHEVEIFRISHKVQGYSGLEGTKILWIVFDANPLLSFDTMNFLIALNGHIVEPTKNLSSELIDFKEAIEHQIKEDKDELCRLRLEARIQHDNLTIKKHSTRKLKEDLWRLTKEEKEYISKVNQANTLDRDIGRKTAHLGDLAEQVERQKRILALLEKRLELIRNQVKPVAVYAEYKSGRGIVSIRITKEQFDKLVPNLTEPIEKPDDMEEGEM